MAVESAPDPQPDETMDGLPTTPVGNSTLAHLAGAAGMVGRLAAAY